MREVSVVGGLTAMVADAERADGERPHLLFLHGMFAGAWMFAPIQRWFADRGYSSHAINLRGHYGSQPVADFGRVSVYDFVDDALHLARALAQPIVIGHSMGGLLAQKLAEAGAARAAILVSAAPPRGIVVTGPSLVVRQLKHLFPILASRPIVPTRSDADALIFNCVPPAEREAFFAQLVPESGRAGRELSLSGVPVDERKVRCPVLSIGAAQDRFVLPYVARALARKYGADYREFPGRGHFMLGEPGWEQVAIGMEEWIARHGAA